MTGGAIIKSKVQTAPKPKPGQQWWNIIDLLIDSVLNIDSVLRSEGFRRHHRRHLRRLRRISHVPLKNVTLFPVSNPKIRLSWIDISQIIDKNMIKQAELSLPPPPLSFCNVTFEPGFIYVNGIWDETLKILISIKVEPRRYPLTRISYGRLKSISSRGVIFLKH